MKASGPMEKKEFQDIFHPLGSLAWCSALSSIITRGQKMSGHTGAMVERRAASSARYRVDVNLDNDLLGIRTGLD